MLIVNEHSTEERKILTACDSEVIGKVYEEGKAQLDLTTEFFQGEEKEKSELKSLLKGVTTLMIIGKEAVSFAEDEGLVTEERVKTVDGVPHAQIVFDAKF